MRNRLNESGSSAVTRIAALLNGMLIPKKFIGKLETTEQRFEPTVAGTFGLKKMQKP